MMNSLSITTTDPNGAIPIASPRAAGTAPSEDLTNVPLTPHAASGGNVSDCSAKVKGCCERIISCLSFCTKPLSAFYNPVYKGARRTYLYLKRHWMNVVAFCISWAAIIVGVGIVGMNGPGFSATAIPLSAGLACGFAMGLFSGVLTTKLIVGNRVDPNATLTFWGGIMSLLLWVDQQGTRPLITAVAVSIIVGATISIPAPMGLVMGITMGNHIAVRIYYWNENEAELSSFENTPTQHLRSEIFKRQSQLTAMQTQLTEMLHQLPGLAHIETKERERRVSSSSEGSLASVAT